MPIFESCKATNPNIQIQAGFKVEYFIVFGLRKGQMLKI